MPMSQNEIPTWYIIYLCCGIYGLWHQQLWYRTREKSHTWYQLRLLDRPWQQCNVDSQHPLGEDRGRLATLHAWPNPHWYQWSNRGAGQIHGFRHHRQAGTQKCVCPPPETGVLDPSVKPQRWRCTSNKWISGWVPRDVYRILRPLWRANIGKSTERKAGRFRNSICPESLNTFTLTIAYLFMRRPIAFKADIQGDLLRMDSAFMKQFSITSTIDVKSWWYTGYVHRWSCNICPNHQDS